MSGAVFVGQKVFQVKNAGMEGESFTFSDWDDPGRRVHLLPELCHQERHSRRNPSAPSFSLKTITLHCLPYPSTRMPLAQKSGDASAFADDQVL